MNYALLLLLLGVVPLLALCSFRPRLIGRRRGSRVSIVGLILPVGVPWEMASVGRTWYSVPRTIWGLRLSSLRGEGLAFFATDGPVAARRLTTRKEENDVR